MATRKNSITLQQHEALARTVHAITRELEALEVRVEEATGSSSSSTRAAARAVIVLETLRSELESVMFKEHRKEGTDVYVYVGRAPKTETPATEPEKQTTIDDVVKGSKSKGEKRNHVGGDA